MRICRTQGFLDQGHDHNWSRRRPTKAETFTLDMAIKIGQAPETTKRHAMTLSRPEARNQTTVYALQTRQRESQLNSSSSPTTNRCK